MEPSSSSATDWSEQRVAAALKAAKSKLERVRQKLHEPLAVVGVGCQFPGAAGADRFWDLLRHGGCPVRPTPTQRWSEALTATADKEPGRITANQGAFLDDVDQWDAAFFGISPREAVSLDPQQRLLLTVTWEALEHAGIDPDQLRGSRTGVFIGICSNDYLHQLTKRDITQIDAYLGTGNAHGAAAGRLSYFFNWQGPSTAIDTACSSSLVAMHLAARSLRAGDCDMAVVGGVNLILAPELSINLSQAGMLSPTGRCQAFAAAADGFVRGEGCGVVLLKRLSDAQAAGDRILCLLRGSAVNQDGRSNGLTAPNSRAQQAVLRSALADAQLTPHDLDYVEAHGTGTALGDPIEMAALGAVFAPQRDPQRPLRVGSVKTNLGHLEGAAGIAGLIKVGLALAHQALPPHLHFRQPSAHIDWRWPVQIPVQLTPWTTTAERPRRAGVSSFGFGGTNAHVILEEAPPVAPTADAPAPPATLLVLSAHTPTALAARARQLAAHGPDAPLADIAYTAAVGRAALPQRLALVAAQRADAQRALETFARDGQAPQVLAGQAVGDGAVALLFAGQGGAHRGAGRALAEHSPTFRALLSETLAAAAAYWPDDLRRVLWDDDEAWHRVDAQPALVVLQIALGRYWRAVGLEPRLLLGHSLGEYAAACLAGVLTLSDTLRLVCARAQLLREHCAPGHMLAVGAPEAELRPLVEPWAEHVAIAAANGPRQTVLAGTAAALAALEPHLTARSWRCRPLTTTHAFHSPLVEPVLEAFRQVAEQISYQRPQWPYVSSLTGSWAQDEVASADYWCRHLRHTVRFHDALQCARAAAPAVYLEVGAGSTLAALVRSTLRDAAPCVLPGLRGDDREWTEHLTTLGQLYVRGTPLRWPQVWGAPRRQVTLPSYPFQRQRYWFAAAAPAPVTALPGPVVPGPVVHPLLGRRLDLAGQEIIYETDLRSVAYLADHRLDGVAVFPTTGYLELALAAGREAGFKLLDVRELKIRRPLTLGADQSGRVQVVLMPDGSGLACRIRRAAPGQWHTHATCRLEAEPAEGAAGSWVAPQGAPRSVAAHYARCRERGLDYGPAFQGLRQLTGAAGQAWGVVALPAQVDPDGYLVHPVLLDACLQVTAAALPDQPAHTWLPVRVRRYRLLQADEPITQLHVHAVAHQSADGNSFLVNITATDARGEHVLIMDELQLRGIERRNAQEGETTAARDSVTSARANITAEIMAWPDGDRRIRMLEHIRGRVAQILESKVNDVPVDRPLDTLGLDSLMAFELREEIKQSLGIEISLEVFLRDVTLIDLSNTLTGKLYARADLEQEELLRNDHSLSAPSNEGLIEGAL